MWFISLNLFAVTTLVLSTSALANGDSGHHKKAHDHKGAAAHWMAPQKAARRPNPVAATTASVQRGAKLYSQYCVSCHGSKGRGDGPAAAALNPRPSDLVTMAPRHPDGGLAWKIAEGRGAMPPWKGTLSENQIWDVVNYLKKGLPSPKGEPRHEDRERESGRHHGGEMKMDGSMMK